MDYYAGITVSLEQSSICVVDGSGKIVLEAKVASGLKRSYSILPIWNCRSSRSAWKQDHYHSGCALHLSRRARMWCCWRPVT